MLDARAICDTCGHTRVWHDRDEVRARLRLDPPVERPCYREIGGAPCRCGGFRESGTLALPATYAAGAPALATSVIRIAALSLVLVVMGLALLYAYRSQTPSVPEVALSQAIQDINSGRVRAVTIAGNTAILEFRDIASHKEQTTLPQSDATLARAVLDYNAANPSQPVELRYDTGNQTLPVVGSIILSLLPVLLIGGFFYYMMSQARRRS